MSEPLRDGNREKKSTAVLIPAPTGGWNTRDSYASMPVTDAVTMDNWISRGSYVEVRKGFNKVVDTSEHNDVIESLMNFNVSGNEGSGTQGSGTQGSGTQQLLAAFSGSIHRTDFKDPLETSSFTNLRDPDAAAFTSNRWNYALYKQTLIMVNGVDNPQFYQGKPFDNNLAAQTGVMPINFEVIEPTFDFKKLNKVVLYRNRLFFAENDSLNLWYATDVATVPVADPNAKFKISRFDLSQFAKKGGHIVLIANWTKTGAEGFGNFLIIVTTEGETFVYEGTNPGDEQAWALRGIYQIPLPVGCQGDGYQGHEGICENFGSDLIILTQDGYFSISSLLNAEYVSPDVAISNKIDTSVRELSEYIFKYWQIKHIKKESMLFVNVPHYTNFSAESDQHVLNVSNGTWSRFTDINATCFEEFKNKTYFGGIKGNLYEMFSSSSKEPQEIQSHIQQAYSNFESSKLKMFKIAKFFFSASLATVFEVDFVVDFMKSQTKYKSSLPTTQSMWGTAQWGKSLWSTSALLRIIQIAIMARPGYYGSIDLTTSAIAADVKWYSTLITMVPEK